MKFDKEKILLIKIKNVVGYLYIPAYKTNKAVIHAKGGPSFGDAGDSIVWSIAKKHNRILFVPDYIGYCRSDGIFNFKNCIKTLYEAEDFLSGKLTATVTTTKEKISLNCDDIVLIGSSWGGAIAPFLEKYRKSSIKYIALAKPVTDWKTQGKTQYPEEKVSETSRSIQSGWSNIYRGFGQSEWPNIFNGQLTEYNPIDNLNLLQDKVVFITHGLLDDGIYWEKSLKFYEKLKKVNSKVYFKTYKNEGHSSKMNALGLKFMLNKIEKENSNKPRLE